MYSVPVPARRSSRLVQLIVSVLVLMIVGGTIYNHLGRLPNQSGVHIWQPGEDLYQSGMKKLRLPITIPSAVMDFDAATKLNPSLAEPYYGRALAYDHYGNIEEELTQLNKALALKPDFFLALVRRASVYQIMKERKKALADLDRAKAIKPQDLSPEDAYSFYFTRCTVLYLMGKLDEALPDCNAAVNALPNLGQTYRARGLLLFEKNQIKESVADFSKSLELEPDYSLQDLAVFFQQQLPQISDPDAKVAVTDLLAKIAQH